MCESPYPCMPNNLLVLSREEGDILRRDHMGIVVLYQLYRDYMVLYLNRKTPIFRKPPYRDYNPCFPETMPRAKVYAILVRLFVVYLLRQLNEGCLSTCTVAIRVIKGDTLLRVMAHMPFPGGQLLHNHKACVTLRTNYHHMADMP